MLLHFWGCKGQLVATVQSGAQSLCVAKSESTSHMGHCVLSQAERQNEPPKSQASRVGLGMLYKQTYLSDTGWGHCSLCEYCLL